MIIAPIATRLSYSTDAVAHQLTATLAAPAADAIGGNATEPAGHGPLDLSRLYPQLFVVATPRPVSVFTARSVVFRVSVMGLAAALLSQLHR